MRIFTVHLRRHGLDPDHDLIVVKEGFSWPAFFLTGFWALYQRLWLAAALMFAVATAINLVAFVLGADRLSQVVLQLAFAGAIGFIANDLKRGKLARMGFAWAGIASGIDPEDAVGCFLEREPDLARTLGA